MNLLASETGRVLKVAHRAFASATPNPLEAIRLARTMQLDGIELDIQNSATGIPVVFHDKQVEMGEGWVKLDELRIDQLRSVPIVTLEEFLQRVQRDELLLVLDIKSRSVLRATLDLVRRYRPSALLASFDVRVLAEARTLAADVPTALVVGFSRVSIGPFGFLSTISNFLMPVRAAQRLGTAAIIASPVRFSVSLINAAHRSGVAVLAWIQNSGDAERARQIPLDGVITDTPQAVAMVPPTRVGQVPAR